MKCYFCGGTGGDEGDTILTSTEFGTICNHCLKEAIMFWKHHHDLGLLE